MKLFYVFLCSGLLLSSCQVDLEGSDPFEATANDAVASKNDNKGASSQSGEEATSETIVCETLFARGSEENAHCFLGAGFSRWGWTNGLLAEGDHSFDLFAAAGQCEAEKGTLVGNMLLQYVEGVAYVTVEMGEGYTLSGTHLYIGNEAYPTDQNGNQTVAPGQFPYQHELEGDSTDYFEVDGLSGEIYVIFHAEVCSVQSSDGSNEGEGAGGADGSEPGTDGGTDNNNDGGTDGGDAGDGGYVPS